MVALKLMWCVGMLWLVVQLPFHSNLGQVNTCVLILFINILFIVSHTCEATFTLNCDLEKHMDCHEAQKKFNYNTCEKTFHIKWRLKKHDENHKGTSASVKQCRYFSNQELCPYKAIGCKFLHVQTECCRFKDCCHSPTQPQHELELDFIMGRNPPPTHPPQELLRHFQATQEADFRYTTLF